MGTGTNSSAGCCTGDDHSKETLQAEYNYKVVRPQTLLRAGRGGPTQQEIVERTEIGGKDQVTLEQMNFKSSVNSDSPVTVDDTCPKLPWSAASIKVHAVWEDQGVGAMKSRILLCLMRAGRLIATHDVFGVYMRDGTQTERVISGDEEIIKLCRTGDQYFIKAIVGDGGRHSLEITQIRCEIFGKSGHRRAAGGGAMGYQLRAGKPGATQQFDMITANTVRVTSEHSKDQIQIQNLLIQISEKEKEMESLQLELVGVKQTLSYTQNELSGVQQTLSYTQNELSGAQLTLTQTQAEVQTHLQLLHAEQAKSLQFQSELSGLQKIRQELTGQENQRIIQLEKDNKRILLLEQENLRIHQLEQENRRIQLLEASLREKEESFRVQLRQKEEHYTVQLRQQEEHYTIQIQSGQEQLRKKEEHFALQIKSSQEQIRSSHEQLSFKGPDANRVRELEFKIQSLEQDLLESEQKCEQRDRRCQQLMSDLKVKSDQLEVELREGMERDLKITRIERTGANVVADVSGAERKYQAEIDKLQERCEELEDTLRMINDEKDATVFRQKQEIQIGGSFVDCEADEHGHGSMTKHLVKMAASSNRFTETNTSFSPEKTYKSGVPLNQGMHREVLSYTVQTNL